MRPALLFAAALACGCVVPKRAGFDDVERLLAARTDTRVHWNQGTSEDAQVAHHVEELLRLELTAASATEIALLQNPKLQATYERLGVAQAEVVQAGLLQNPTITGHMGFPIGPGLIEYNGSIVGSFLDLFLIPLKKKMANAAFRRVKLEVADAVLELAADVRIAFYTAQASTQTVELRKVVFEADQVSAELAARQHEAGNLSDLDLSVEQNLYTQARLDLARAEAQLVIDRERLSRLLGVWGQRTQWKVAPKLPELPPDDPPLNHVEAFAIEHRLDLSAAREEMRAIASTLQITKGTRFIGGLGAGADVHRDPDGPLALGPTVTIELPIFDQKQATIFRLRSELRAAERRLDALAIGIRSEVREARARVLLARAAVDYYHETVLPLRERMVAQSQQQYNAMLLGVYQLLQAKQNEVNGYREYLESVRDYWIARSDLERALGARLPEAASSARQGETR